jgi:hypothetical protein
LFYVGYTSADWVIHFGLQIFLIHSTDPSHLTNSYLSFKTQISKTVSNPYLGLNSSFPLCWLVLNLVHAFIAIYTFLFKLFSFIIKQQCGDLVQ